MPRCTICKLDNDVLTAVNKRLRDGVGDTDIAKEYSVSRDAVRRHRLKNHHVPPDVQAQADIAVKFHELKAVDRDVTMQDAINTILTKLDYFDSAWLAYMERGAVKSAVDVHKEIRQTLQLLYNIKGWLKTDSTMVNIQINAQLDGMVDTLFAAVEECPRCKAKLQAALEGMRDVTE